MDELLKAVTARAEGVLKDLNRPGGLKATIQNIRRKMAEADQKRAISRARAELKRLEQQLTETITAVGVQAVALHEAGRLGSEELAPLCQHVVDIKATLAEEKEELAALEALVAAREQQTVERCTSCGRPLPEQGLYCAYCGAPIPSRVAAQPPAPAPARHCVHCGAELRPGSKFCPVCGQPVAD